MTTRKRGRPRLTTVQRRAGATPDEEILDAAAELFAANGFSATSTRAIAEAVGVRQSSLYHHFSSKSDILDTLLSATVEQPLTLANWLLASPRDAPASLYAMAWFDVHQLLANAWNLGVILQLPEARDPSFEHFYDQRSQLQAAYRKLTSAALAESDSTLPYLAFHLVESAIGLRSDQADWVLEQGPERIATALADTVLRSVAYDGDFAELREHSAAILSEFANLV